jgi:Mlc titration factor MtfA (ptsG expression regulator)
MPLSWFARRPPAIDDDLWREVLERFPFAAHLSADDLARLRALCEQFLRRKTISGAHEFPVTPQVRAAIAFQACLPALNLGLAGYDDFVEIVVYPAQFLVPRKQTDDAGVVHESVEALAGEAMDGGPVVLSWEDVAGGPQQYGTNVTIHEFVHKLDLADGEADGIPPLPASRRRRWRETMERAYDAFCDELDRIERTIPRHVDPESAAADRWYASLPLDPYAATDPAEFFAVSGEAFFVAPELLADAFPDWYRELAQFFRQDPLLGHEPPPLTPTGD